jgi:trehalose-phosphatase
VTRHLFDAWTRVAKDARRAERLAIFTDFDGTLAPIRRRAAEARLSARVRRALERLTARGHLVAVISGRPLVELEAKIGIAGVWYAGSHGYFLRAPDGAELSLLRRDERRLIVRTTHRLSIALEGMTGVLVEPKPGAIAIHYRAASPVVRKRVGVVVKKMIGATAGLRLTPGRMVWEILPAGPVDKYLASRFILLAARHRDARPAVWSIYLGDDVSDERVFEKWRGVSVAVGRRPHTAAKFFVKSPAEVAECLERLDVVQSTSRQRGDAANAARIMPT